MKTKSKRLCVETNNLNCNYQLKIQKDYKYINSRYNELDTFMKLLNNISIMNFNLEFHNTITFPTFVLEKKYQK